MKKSILTSLLLFHMHKKGEMKKKKKQKKDSIADLVSHTQIAEDKKWISVPSWGID